MNSLAGRAGRLPSRRACSPASTTNSNESNECIHQNIARTFLPVSSAVFAKLLPRITTRTNVLVNPKPIQFCLLTIGALAIKTGVGGYII